MQALVQRLESAALHWIRQIQDVIGHDASNIADDAGCLLNHLPVILLEFLKFRLESVKVHWVVVTWLRTKQVICFMPRSDI